MAKRKFTVTPVSASSDATLDEISDKYENSEVPGVREAWRRFWSEYARPVRIGGGRKYWETSVAMDYAIEVATAMLGQESDEDDIFDLAVDICNDMYEFV